MSLRDLANTTSSIDDFDDQPTDNGNEAPPPVRTSAALANAMLDAALTPRLRRLLASSAILIVIKTVDAATAELLDHYLSTLERGRTIESFTESHKSGGKREPRGRAELTMLERGHSVVLISQDPDRIIVPEALASADAVIDVPAPRLALVRQVIRVVTGKVVRGLQDADIGGLEIYDIITAIRPNLTPRQCVKNLRRAADMRRVSPGTNGAIPLHDLALTKVVSDWAGDTVEIMNKVASGELGASALPYACLEGPPGCGKTTVAASLARSAEWGFVDTSVGSWFAESGGHLGDVIRAARKFFDALAHADGPVVGLIDEIDSLPNRAAIDADREKLDRLYKLVEDGAELDDVLRDRICILRSDHERAKAAFERGRLQASNDDAIEPARIIAFSNLLTSVLDSAENPARKAWLRSLLSKVEVDADRIRIVGSKDVLSAAVATSTNSGENVQKCVPKWRTRHDSNV